MKGSIVIKKTTLTSLIMDMKSMLLYGTQMSKGARDIVRGELIAFEMILNREYNEYTWDVIMQELLFTPGLPGSLNTLLKVLED